jgi:hypothetical protein
MQPDIVCGSCRYEDAIEVRRALDRLAANLATAGALCQSFRISCDYWVAHDSPYVCDEELHAMSWHPGCSRAAPGWGGE